MAGKLTIDVKSAIGDFRRYDKVTQRRFKKTLVTKGGVLKNKQFRYLFGKVKNWNNGIGSTFSVSKVKDMSVDVGPGEKVAYAWFLEAGASVNQKAKGNTFAGYFYVKNTLKSIERELITALKKDIERFKA